MRACVRRNSCAITWIEAWAQLDPSFPAASMFQTIVREDDKVTAMAGATLPSFLHMDLTADRCVTTEDV